MLGLTESLRYYLYNRPTDMRKSFDALCQEVRGGMRRDPLSGEVFIFLNQRRDLMKMLHWERGGLVLYYKRLEKGTYELPLHLSEDGTTKIHWPELIMMIEGLSLRDVKVRKRYVLTKAG